jgi:hypothetical protein
MRIWAVGLVAAFFCGPAWANIGTIVTATGTGTNISRSGQSTPGQKDSAIESNDIVTTAAGTVNIDFVDHTKVTITEQSRLVIDDFVYDAKKSDASKLGLKVALGTVRYASGQIAKTNHQNVDIQTPTATVAVRGTDFFMTVDEIGRSFVSLVPSCDHNGNCITGAIDVITPGGKVTLDQAFTATAVMKIGAAPTPPVSIPADVRAINNMLIISQPADLKKAVLKQLESRETTASATGAEAAETMAATALSNNLDNSDENLVNKIVVKKSPDSTTAFRVKAGTGSVYLFFPHNDSAKVSITQQNDTATADLNGGTGNKITIKQSR